MARSPVRLGLSLDLQEASKLLRFMGNQELLNNIYNNGISNAMNTKNKAYRQKYLNLFNLLYKAPSILITKRQIQRKLSELFLFLKN